MYEESSKGKYLGEFLFKFKLMMDRTTLIMNQNKNVGQEFYVPSDKLPFIAYVENVNSNTDFKLDNKEASDEPIEPMHSSFSINIIDGFNRAV